MRILAAMALLAALAGTLALITLRASLPRLDGTVAAPGLHGPVTVDRDRLGVVTVSAGDRADLAFGIGYAHGQDRFFQMDLARRLAAGELAELFGAIALSNDEATRRFRFRSLARTQLERATTAERSVLEAYASGVNAGLQSLRSRPWEYWLLRAAPLGWRPEDTLLASDAMWWDLQSEAFDRERLRQEINGRLGGALCAGGWKCALGFLYPARTPWDAPLQDSTAPAETLEIPGPEALNVRAAPAHGAARWPGVASSAMAVGSNNWAVSGRLTRTGAALIANDMHLTQRVPPTWYRARLRLVQPDGSTSLELNGLTLPGAPLLVAGSNGHIAWGFTNSYGAWWSIEHLQCTSIGQDALRTPQGAVPLTRVNERIHVRGAPDASLDVLGVNGAVLIDADPASGSCWSVAWLAQQPDATNLGLLQLERAGSVSEAMALAPVIGIPHQNFVVGDAQGHIGWSIAGRIPLDTGPRRAAGEVRWIDPADQPRILDPPIGRIWSANARVVSDPAAESLLGGAVASLGAEYDLGARARQVRDALLALDRPATPADMLGIQLDERALFLDHWHTLLLGLLDERSVSGHPERAAARRALLAWNGHASVDSVAYRLTRACRDRIQRELWRGILGALDIPGDVRAPVPAQFEQALWLMVTRQPLHLLGAQYAGWQEFLLAQVDATVSELQGRCGSLDRCSWGERNTIRIRHPLSAALPGLSALLDMPTLQLPGDENMPRVQDGNAGASERFAVSPGHESEGYMELPGGQSGHPLSPYYAAGFAQWARGEALPFLPGPAEHTLRLEPAH